MVSALFRSFVSLFQRHTQRSCRCAGAVCYVHHEGCGFCTYMHSRMVIDNPADSKKLAVLERLPHERGQAVLDGCACTLCFLWFDFPTFQSTKMPSFVCATSCRGSFIGM